MSDMDWTTCKKCGRVVFVQDADKDGRCSFCPVRKEAALVEKDADIDGEQGQ